MGGQQMGSQQMSNQQLGSQTNNQMAVQVGSQMGQQTSSFTGGSMPMSQHYGNMLTPEGSPSQAYMVVAMPPNGAQMPYAVPQMMSPTNQDVAIGSGHAISGQWSGCGVGAQQH